jgi:hypothetical protein
MKVFLLPRIFHKYYNSANGPLHDIQQEKMIKSDVKIAPSLYVKTGYIQHANT